jgi:hypothetical protein
VPICRRLKGRGIGEGEGRGNRNYRQKIGWARRMTIEIEGKELGEEDNNGEENKLQMKGILFKGTDVNI